MVWSRPHSSQGLKRRTLCAYADPVLDPPGGSEVIDDWQFFYAVARRMGLDLDVPGLDMNHAPTIEKLFALTSRSARTPLAESGSTRTAQSSTIPEPSWGRATPARRSASCADPEMMAELDGLATLLGEPVEDAAIGSVKEC
jgi:hypothetical protein